MPADALVLLSHRIRSVFRDLAQEKGKKVPGYAWHIDLRETVFQLPVRLYFGGVHNGINKIQFIDVAHLGLTRTREIVRAICGDLDAVRIARLDCCVDIDIPLLDLALYCRLALVQNCTIVRSRTGTTFYLRHSYPRKAMMYDKLRQLEFAGDPTIKAYVWEGPLTRVEVQLRSSGLPFRRFIDLERYAKLDMLPNLSFWEVGRKRDGLTAIDSLAAEGLLRKIEEVGLQMTSKMFSAQEWAYLAKKFLRPAPESKFPDLNALLRKSVHDWLEDRIRFPRLRKRSQ
jgi:hypothetical protein